MGRTENSDRDWRDECIDDDDVISNPFFLGRSKERKDETTVSMISVDDDQKMFSSVIQLLKIKTRSN